MSLNPPALYLLPDPVLDSALEGVKDDVAGSLRAIASCSPYLASIFRTDHEWILSQVAKPNENLVTETLADVSNSGGELGTKLRLAKKRAAFIIAYQDLTKNWSLDQTTRTLSDFADACLDIVLQHLIETEKRKGTLPDALGAEQGLVIMAMGKHGSRELNYSSDIDLIVLFDDELYDDADVTAVRRIFVRMTKKLVKLISEATVDGYVFRTDLRLRPDPSVTPVCMSMYAAERYYESLGRTWERAAMIKARPAAGNKTSGDAFLTRIEPFVWRKHLDFAAIQDAEDMLFKIRAHKGLTGEFEFAGHDLKLGRGGIREIEFFAQTQQLIFGGRDASLRSPETVETLYELANTGRISRDRAESLVQNYRFLRTLEHRLQMIDDAQTHSIPKAPEKLERLAAFCGISSVEELERMVMERLEETHSSTDLPGSGKTEHVVTSSEMSIALTNLEEEWSTRPALRTNRAREVFRRIRPALIKRFERAENPTEALAQFDRFLRALPSGVQLFSLFDANNNLLDLVVDICGIAPELARYLAQNAQVLDVVLDAAFFQPLPDVSWYLADLQTRLATYKDYEAALDMLRLWQKEQHFRVGVHLLRGLSDPSKISAAYSAIAEASVAQLIPRVIDHIVRRYGTIEGDGIAVIAMGKLGSREMTAKSDLDLILVYDAAEDSLSTGKKQLPAPTYFARLTQALITAMTAPTSQGRLYEVDMRLRPSGRQGPVATSLSSFADYQRESAWTWEHLALTRARCIAGAPQLRGKVEAVIHETLCTPKDAKKILTDVGEMRLRLQAAKSDADQDVWETKHGSGRLMDIELFVQAGALINGSTSALSFGDRTNELMDRKWLDRGSADQLLGYWELLVAVQHVARLVGEGFSFSMRSAAQLELLCNATSRPDLAAIQQDLTKGATFAKGLIAQYLSPG